MNFRLDHFIFCALCITPHKHTNIFFLLIVLYGTIYSFDIGWLCVVRCVRCICTVQCGAGHQRLDLFVCAPYDFIALTHSLKPQYPSFFFLLVTVKIIECQHDFPLCVILGLDTFSFYFCHRKWWWFCCRIVVFATVTDIRCPKYIYIFSGLEINKQGDHLFSDFIGFSHFTNVILPKLFLTHLAFSIFDIWSSSTFTFIWFYFGSCL